MVIGLSLNILYLNLFDKLYNFFDYVKFITRNISLYIFLLGLIIINLTYYLRREKYGICL